MTNFDEVYARYAAAVFGYALKCAGRRDVAEDITSEVFMTLHAHWPSIDVAKLPGWLFSVARNKAIDYWRRAEVEQRYVNALSTQSAPVERSLERWLADTPSLKPVHRACLILRYVHGMTRAQIGERLALTDNQVKGCLQYALTLLRRELEKIP